MISMEELEIQVSEIIKRGVCATLQEALEAVKTSGVDLDEATAIFSFSSRIVAEGLEHKFIAKSLGKPKRHILH